MTTRTTSPPPNWQGTNTEWLLYSALIELGYQPGQDFYYQPSNHRNSVQSWGLEVSFQFVNPPNLAINVNGIYYQGALGSYNKAEQIFTREALAGQGVTLIFVDEEDVMQDAVGIAEDALSFKDRSRLGSM